MCARTEYLLCLFNGLKYTHTTPSSPLSPLSLNSIKKIINIEYCSVFLIKDSIDGQSKELISNVTTKDSTKREIRVKLGSGIAGTVALTGRMILVKVNRLICIALCAVLCCAVLCCACAVLCFALSTLL